MKLMIKTMLMLLFSAQIFALNCGDDVNSSTSLTEDLHCTTGAYALRITSDDVLLQLNSYTISGTRSMTGIETTNKNNVKIYNGVIKGFGTGISIINSDYFQVNGVNLYDLNTGVWLDSSSLAQINHNNFLYMDLFGIYVTNYDKKTQAHQNNMAFNQFYKNRMGIQVCGGNSDKHMIRSNFIWKSIDWGIGLNQSNNNSIEFNDIVDSEYDALRIHNSSYNLVRSNNIDNGYSGISIIADENTACSGIPTNESRENRIMTNYLRNLEFGAVLGLGIDTYPRIIKNSIYNNKIYNDIIGIQFREDAYYNITKNGYQGTITPIDDSGTGNSY